MSAAPFWAKAYGDPEEGAFDFVWIAGQLIPGVSRVKGLKCKRDVETNKSPNTKGAKHKDKGEEPPEFQIVTRIWTPEQWEQWQKVRPSIDPLRPTAVSQPLEIVHPVPNYVGINEIIITEIEDDPPENNSEPYILTFHCEKYYAKTTEAKSSKAVKTANKSDNWVELLEDDKPNFEVVVFGAQPGVTP